MCVCCVCCVCRVVLYVGGVVRVGHCLGLFSWPNRGAAWLCDSAFCWVWWGKPVLDWMGPYGPGAVWVLSTSPVSWEVVHHFRYCVFMACNVPLQPPAPLFYSHNPINRHPKPLPENQPELDYRWHLHLISTSWLCNLPWFLSPLINALWTQRVSTCSLLSSVL